MLPFPILHEPPGHAGVASSRGKDGTWAALPPSPQTSPTNSETFSTSEDLHIAFSFPGPGPRIIKVRKDTRLSPFYHMYNVGVPGYEATESLHNIYIHVSCELHFTSVPLLCRFLGFFPLPSQLLVLLATAEKSTQQIHTSVHTCTCTCKSTRARSMTSGQVSLRKEGRRG